MHKVKIQNGRLCITPEGVLSDFIQHRYGGRRPNTQLKYAQIIAKFLGDCDIDDLTTEYVKGYMTRLAWSGISKETCETARRTIEHFCEYLEGRLLIAIDHESLQGLPSAPAQVSEKINDIKPEYLALFIRTAMECQPRIAFPIVLSMAAGLRAGEVLNLSKSAISCIGPWGKDGWILQIKDRPLRADWHAFCKKTRQQRGQSLGELGAYLYRTHLEKYTSEDTEALVTDKNGNAMTYQTYMARFARVKKHFIKALKDSDDPSAVAYGVFLETRRWGTHIGRGVFSNDGSRNTKNIAELAGMRGDTNPGSSIPYLQTDAVERLGHLQQYITDDLLGEVDR